MSDDNKKRKASQKPPESPAREMKRKASNVEILLFNGLKDEHSFGTTEDEQYETFLETLPKREKAKVLKLEKELLKKAPKESMQPIKYRILVSSMPEDAKVIAIQRLELFSRLGSDDQEFSKQKEWFETLLKIPFTKEIGVPRFSTDSNSKVAIQNYLNDLTDNLNKDLYGMQNAKETFLQISARSITNPDSTSHAIALQSPPGCGKTLAVQAFARAIGRPFHLVALGGAKDSSLFIGHDYTYLNSKCGLLASILIQSGCMNPIVLFDELDKVSGSHQGEEIIGLLIHLIDNTQNRYVQDRYFSGINLDFSKVLFVFSFNDETKIDPVLLDRISIINLKKYTTADKLIIAKKHMVPNSLANVGIPSGHLQFSDEVIKEIISTYTNGEAGVRSLKKCVDTICMQVNLMTLNGNMHPKMSLSIHQRPIHIVSKDLSYLLKDIEIKDRAYLSMYV